MCDYSLMGIPNRLAREGEELVVHTFLTRTKGMTSPASLSSLGVRSALWERLKSIFWPAKMKPIAVCIPPGARLKLRDIPTRIQNSLDVGSLENVTFAQLGPAEYLHRDAVRFGNGAELSLQNLTDGQRVIVLSLGFDLDVEVLDKPSVPIVA